MSALFFARLARASRLLLAVALLLGSFTFLSTSSGGSKMREELPVLSPPGNVQAQANGVPAVEGWVTEKSTGKPVVGATIRIENRSTVSGVDGYFSFSAAELGLSGGKTHNTFTPLRVEVEAPYFAPWLLTSAKYYNGDTLRVYPRLMHQDESTSQARNPIFSYVVGQENDSTTIIHQQIAGNLALNVNITALTPPATIRVYRTATGIVEVVPFREYVKYVLPNEWVPSWSSEAIKAGAMAVKSYGWYWVSRGGKQLALGADVKDNVDDQVYDPNVSYASTDAAVDATFNYAITRNGDLFQAQYCAGNYRADPAGDCPWPTQYMTQWGSSYHADQGRTWGWILGFYYGGSVITPRPPGGVYTGPPPTSAPAATRAAAPPAPPPSGAFSIGQGSARADVFQAAYDRNGGAGVLGRSTGPVRWWMQYVSEFNVVAQSFSGADGRGNVWLVFDVLKANDVTGYRAYLLSGNIASAYADHVPPGPEWIGAPTSNPYVADPAKPMFRSQGFSRGALVESNTGVQFVAGQGQVAPPTPIATTNMAAVRVRVQWLGRPAAPSDSWIQPLTLHLSTSSDPSILATYRGMTDRNGVVFFEGLAGGVFNVHVKGAHTLQTARAGVTLSDNVTAELDMKAQVEGDTDGDNCVTVADFALVQSMLGTHKDTPGFNPTAD
ncbi:MAG: SpoIID/LytB domain-containing protein, partial [Chloroflexia bacterium]